MKRYILLTALMLLSIVTYASDNTVIYVAVVSNDGAIDEKKCHIIEDEFQRQLQNMYDVRLFRDEGVFAEEKAKELAYHEGGSVRSEDIKSFGEECGADLLCVVSVEKQNFGDGQLYFRAKIFDVESAVGVKKKIAVYPGHNDNEIESIDNHKVIYMVTSSLLEKLGINEGDNKDLGKKIRDDLKGEKKNNNVKAFGASLIPGVGLMLKGRYGEGATYMVGDLALLGGGIGFLQYAKNQESLKNNKYANYDQVINAQKNSNNAKIASYSCFGAAATLYVVNLIRAYVAKPKSGARLYYAIVPSVIPSQFGNYNISLNLALTYKF